MSDRQHFKLSPSEFAYLYEECPRCYYEARHGLSQQPKSAFPAIFNRIEDAICERYDGKSPQTFDEALPAGRLILRQRWVKSGVIEVPGHAATVSINGRIDGLMRFSPAGFGVVDVKVCAHDDERMAKYARQLWAYAYSLEHPLEKVPPLAPVTHLGLFVVQSEACAEFGMGEQSYLLLHMVPKWVPVEKDDAAFLRFLGEVLDVLELPEPPDPDPTCKFCAYRARG
jgi:hypothetical protein